MIPNARLSNTMRATVFQMEVYRNAFRASAQRRCANAPSLNPIFLFSYKVRLRPSRFGGSSSPLNGSGKRRPGHVPYSRGLVLNSVAAKTRIRPTGKPKNSVRDRENRVGNGELRTAFANRPDGGAITSAPYGDGRASCDRRECSTSYATRMAAAGGGVDLLYGFSMINGSDLFRRSDSYDLSVRCVSCPTCLRKS